MVAKKRVAKKQVQKKARRSSGRSSETAVALQSASSTLPVMSLSDVRGQFPLAMEAAQSNTAVLLKRYNDERGAIVGERFVRLLKQMAEPSTPFSSQVAWLVVAQWLGPSAPAQLFVPQLKELSGLSTKHLEALYQGASSNSASVPRSLAKILERLEKRREAVRAMNSARESGLYDVTEASSDDAALGG